jgi:hypothetical protein
MTLCRKRKFLRGFEERAGPQPQAPRNSTCLRYALYRIEVEEAKLSYVKSIKKSSVERAGLEAITSVELAELIRGKISASYIYNLVFLEEHDVAKFNIIIELPSRSSREATRFWPRWNTSLSKKLFGFSHCFESLNVSY